MSDPKEVFSRAFAWLVDIEGDYSDDPADSGGKTRYGITESAARENGYTGNMRDLPLEFAERVTKTRYWDTNKLDDICALDEDLAVEMLECGYNCGIQQPAKFLQIALNGLNNQENIYPDVLVDAKIGPKTISALEQYLDYRGDVGRNVLLRAMNCQQGMYYINLAQKRPKDERFLYGWLKERIELV